MLDRNVETLDALFLVSDGLLSSFASTGLGNWQLQTPVPPAPAPRVRRLFCFWCVCVCVCVCVLSLVLRGAGFLGAACDSAGGGIVG